VTREIDEMTRRAQGALLGLAVGDAAGMPKGTAVSFCAAVDAARGKQ